MSSAPPRACAGLELGLGLGVGVGLGAGLGLGVGVGLELGLGLGVGVGFARAGHPLERAHVAVTVGGRRPTLPAAPRRVSGVAHLIGGRGWWWGWGFGSGVGVRRWG